MANMRVQGHGSVFEYGRRLMGIVTGFLGVEKASQ